jgi:hypothetical protein
MTASATVVRDMAPANASCAAVTSAAPAAPPTWSATAMAPASDSVMRWATSSGAAAGTMGAEPAGVGRLEQAAQDGDAQRVADLAGGVVVEVGLEKALDRQASDDAGQGARAHSHDTRHHSPAQ